MPKVKKPQIKTAAEIAHSIRSDRGEVKPYTRIHESKKHEKPKHKKRGEEKNYE